MPNVPSPVISRLRKLCPLLGSEHPGEVVNAARKIEQALKGVGLDFPALVEAIGSAPYDGAIPQNDPRSAPRLRSWREAARLCRDNDNGRLTSDERALVFNRAEGRVPDGGPTRSQEQRLQSIYARLLKGHSQ